ncbi:MAG: TIGR02757 family protein [bacterium]
MRRERLKPFLERVLAKYGKRELLGTDPLQVVHRYEGARDQEVVGFLAAGLAFGNVKAIVGALDQALGVLGEHPAAALKGIQRKNALRLARGFNYRWVRDVDLANVYSLLGAALRAHGRLEPLFAAGMREGAEDTLGGAASLVEGLRALAPQGVDLSRRGTRSFMPAVHGAGASKRMHMFLRWMVREDELDLGLWSSARPAQLIVPLDRHIARMARHLGLTARRTPGRAMALEITAALRALDAEDPIKYDFALCRLGILGECPAHRDPTRCQVCMLEPVCRLPSP